MGSPLDLCGGGGSVCASQLRMKYRRMRPRSPRRPVPLLASHKYLYGGRNVSGTLYRCGVRRDGLLLAGRSGAGAAAKAKLAGVVGGDVAVLPHVGLCKILRGIGHAIGQSPHATQMRAGRRRSRTRDSLASVCASLSADSWRGPRPPDRQTRGMEYESHAARTSGAPLPRCAVPAVAGTARGACQPWPGRPRPCAR